MKISIETITGYDKILNIEFNKWEISFIFDPKRWVLGFDFTVGIWIQLFLFDIYIGGIKEESS